MFGSIVDIHSPTVEIRRGKKEKERRRRQKPQGKNIMVCPITQGDHKNSPIWPPYEIGQAIYIFILWFLLLSFFFFSSPNLSGRRLDVYHTSTHGVALVRIQNACVKCAANTERKKSPFWHHPTICRAISSQLRHVSTSGKNLLSSNISSTCPHNIVNFGPLAAEICWRIWAPLQISTGLTSWQRYCTVFQYWASAKLCGVEQRAPPIFGRVTITLGIGPHFQFPVCYSKGSLVA